MKDPLKALSVQPIGQGDLAGAEASAQGENPVCGDKLCFSGRIERDGTLTLGFLATACPATIAVASCAVQLYSGQTLPEGPPFADLRHRVQELGGLSRFEAHTLSLVEQVLANLFRACETRP